MPPFLLAVSLPPVLVVNRQLMTDDRLDRKCHFLAMTSGRNCKINTKRKIMLLNQILQRSQIHTDRDVLFTLTVKHLQEIIESLSVFFPLKFSLDHITLLLKDTIIL